MHVRRHRRAPLLVALAVAGAAACAERRAASDRDSATATPPVALAPVAAFRARLGVTWELARLDTQAMPPSRVRADSAEPGRHPGPGVRPTLTFTNDSPGALSDDPALRHARGWSFCNGWGTAYQLGPGDTLRFHGVQSTLVGCYGPDSLETRYFRALGKTQRFALHGDSLSLVAADGSRLTFVPARVVADPAAK